MVNVQRGDSEVDIMFERCSLSHDILKAASKKEPFKPRLHFPN